MKENSLGEVRIVVKRERERERERERTTRELAIVKPSIMGSEWFQMENQGNKDFIM